MYFLQQGPETVAQTGHQVFKDSFLIQATMVS